MILSRSAPAISIVPQPPPPGLYVTLGPRNLVGWALEMISKTLADPSRIVWVDAANAFNAYIVSMAARSVLKDPAHVLRSYHVARPFTAYQLEAMISEKLLPAVRRVNALVSVVADPLHLFADAEGRDTQIRQCYTRFIFGLRAAASETAVLVLSTAEPSRYTQPLLSSATRLTQLSFVDHRPLLEEIHGTHIANHDPIHPL
jgi:hypothetical protein